MQMLPPAFSSVVEELFVGSERPRHAVRAVRIANKQTT
jgi:hypothetical protein